MFARLGPLVARHPWKVLAAWLALALVCRLLAPRWDDVTLDGEDWLRCLDEGLSQSVFSAGAGALLRDGGFRTDVAANEVDALRVVARARFLDWMRGA